ncbi:sigma-70 family RNA polymerase sigma factor [Neorhizobium sp. NPDC001467]|uniref:sigma-70 family RNA polymerase sigma factor n=1 Tax=Neorhizobium sp. NPDC001467 TaxID=3390595 RepID=UPI003D04D5FE
MSSKRQPFDVLAQLSSLRRYARSLVRHPDDAEDLVHDALVRAYERKATFRTGGNLRNWLLSIVHNTHIDRLRRAKSLDRRHDDAAYLTDTVEQGDPHHSIRLRQLREAFHALPDEQRDALHLVAIEGLSYQDAASALSIPVGTLMSRISRAREKLRAFEEGRRDVTASHLKIIEGGRDETR